MPLIQGSTSTPAATVTPNVLAGSIYEYLPFRAAMRIGLVDAAAGEQRVTVTVGPTVLLEESPVSVAARVPIMPDDFLLRGVGQAGARLVIKVRNTGVGANILRWAVDLQPV